MLLKEKKEIINWLNRYNIINYELIEDNKYGYIVNVNYVNLMQKKLKSIDVKFNHIKNSFICSNNHLISLEGCPNKVGGTFDCSWNNLKTLEGCPEIVEVDFICHGNELESLKYCPEIINGRFNCNNNKLTIEGLKYFPKEIKENVIKSFNNEKLGSLQYIENFEELKEKINIYFEKENLLKRINKNIVNNKIINKI